MKYVIDIDGVISKKTDWSYIDSYLRLRAMFLNIEVNVEVVKKINELYDKGDTIILHTSRLWHDYDVTVEWLKKHGVKYSTLIMAKPLGDYYIDDKNKTIKEFLNESTG